MLYISSIVSFFFYFIFKIVGFIVYLLMLPKYDMNMIGTRHEYGACSQILHIKKCRIKQNISQYIAHF